MPFLTIFGQKWRRKNKLPPKNARRSLGLGRRPKETFTAGPIPNLNYAPHFRAKGPKMQPGKNFPRNLNPNFWGLGSPASKTPHILELAQKCRRCVVDPKSPSQPPKIPSQPPRRPTFCRKSRQNARESTALLFAELCLTRVNTHVVCVLTRVGAWRSKSKSSCSQPASKSPLFDG